MADARESLYEILGVARDAGQEAIRRAYRSRARELHPDVSREADAAGRFAELTRAYAVLGTPTTRLLYDRIGYLGRGNGGFEARASSNPSGHAADVRDLPEVRVTASAAAGGTAVCVSVSSVELCPSCAGTGAATGAASDACSACGGEGRLRASRDLGGARLLELATCAACAGRGRVVETPCDACAGAGRATWTRTVTVPVAAGARDGDVIRADRDDVTHGVARSRDVYVRLRVVPDPDPRLVRYAATVALAVALVLFVVVATVPEML